MIKRLLLGLAVLALLLATVFIIARLSGLTDAQREALVLMSEPVVFEGENAFDHLWLLRYDVPEDEWKTVIAEDQRRWEVFLSQPYSERTHENAPVSRAEEAYSPIFEGRDTQDVLCVGSDPCLQKVAAQPERTAAFVDSHARFFAKLEALREADYYQHGVSFHSMAPMPAFQHSDALATRHALRFHEGDHQAALAGACEDFALWRRLAHRSDTMIAQMIGIAFAGRRYAPLIGDMLARLPADAPVPAACRSALSPPQSEEISLCLAMKGELAYFRSNLKWDLLTNLGTDGLWLNSLTFNPRKTEGMVALQYASVCDSPPSRPAVERNRENTGLLYWRCADNIVGCLLFNNAQADYSDYRQRKVDFMGRVEALATLLWLKETPPQRDQLLAERLEQRPRALKTSGRDMRISPDASSLLVEQRDRSLGGHDGVMRLPLPGSQHAASTMLASEE